MSSLMSRPEEASAPAEESLLAPQPVTEEEV